MKKATPSLVLAFALTADASAQTAMWGGAPGRNLFRRRLERMQSTPIAKWLG